MKPFSKRSRSHEARDQKINRRPLPGPFALNKLGRYQFIFVLGELCQTDGRSLREKSCAYCRLKMRCLILASGDCLDKIKSSIASSRPKAWIPSFVCLTHGGPNFYFPQQLSFQKNQAAE